MFLFFLSFFLSHSEIYGYAKCTARTKKKVPKPLKIFIVRRPYEKHSNVWTNFIVIVLLRGLLDQQKAIEEKL
jgi:hypothetical protein